MSELLPCVTLEPRAGSADAAIVWLHGLGADGHDFVPIVPELGLDPALRPRFVFPHAPSMPVTLNGGMVMPAWYDIVGLDLERRHDEAGIRRSAEQVEALIADQRAKGIAADRIVLAGFSQGGAIALHVGLRHPERLAGILALSTYLVLEDQLEAERSPANEGLSIFQAHGSFDPMVPHARGEAACERLRALGYDVAFTSYPMQHAVHPDEIAAIGVWLNERLRTQSS